MSTHNLKIHLAHLEETKRDFQPFKNLSGSDMPFKLGYFTDKMNQDLCMGKEVFKKLKQKAQYILSLFYKTDAFSDETT